MEETIDMEKEIIECLDLDSEDDLLELILDEIEGI